MGKPQLINFKRVPIGALRPAFGYQREGLWMLVSRKGFGSCQTSKTPSIDPPEKARASEEAPHLTVETARGIIGNLGAEATEVKPLDMICRSPLRGNRA